MATKTFNLSWMRQYRASSNSYSGSNSPIRVGSTYGYHSYLGFPTAVRTALKESSTTPQLRLKIYVTDATSEWDLGRHKLAGSSEPSYTTMPWYNYLRAVQGQGTGWLSFNLTSDFMNDYEKGTYQGIVLYSAQSTSFYGEASNSGSTRAVVEVTGTWNDPPNKPTITAPTGGETVDDKLTVRWTSGGDPDGDSLRYQIAYSGGASTSGYSYTGLTSAGATSITLDTSNWTEGSYAQVAVRAYDGEFYSDYTYSARFTVDHNSAPKTPTQLSPVNGQLVDRTQVTRFSWKHNDDGAQAGFQLAWRTVSSTGVRGSWTYLPSQTTYYNTTNQYYNMPANTLPNSDIEWTVQTKDQKGETSGFANYVVFKARNATNAPVFLDPTNNEVISRTRVVVNWSSLNQQEWNLILKDANGVTLWQTTQANKTKYIEVPYDLSNNSAYSIDLRVKDTVNLIWSEYSTVNFTTSFSPPREPVVIDWEESGEGIVSVFYSHHEGDFAPRLILGAGKQNPRLNPYNTTTENDYEILSYDSVRLSGAEKGIEFNLTNEDLPLVSGRLLTFSAVSDSKGGRLVAMSYDANDNVLGTTATPTNEASTVVGLMSTTHTIPANTARVRLIVMSTWDNVGDVVMSDIRLRGATVEPATQEIEMYRREYTPEGENPWVKIADGLAPEGSFIDYTPASGVTYEYMVKAIANNDTSADSTPKQVILSFDYAMLQLADNLPAIYPLKYAYSREVSHEIESGTQTFAGRTRPVREFGEHKFTTISLEWEVDEYDELRIFEKMFDARGVMLYRDPNGRRQWVTTGELDVKDKEVRGFVLSSEFTVTDYNEDLGEELI